MKLYSWNVNGVRAIHKKGFLEWMKGEQADILCLQETKATMSQLEDELLHVEGYHSFWSTPLRKGYSGVATYTKEKPLSIKYDIGIPAFDQEGRIVITEYEAFTLLNIYFPNGQSSDERLKYKLDFYDSLLTYMDEQRQQGKKIIVCGDFNTAHREIDLKHPKANEKTSGFLPIERQWMDQLISHGYVDVFRTLYPEEVKYSWWSYRMRAREKNVGWRLDYFFVSDDLMPEVKGACIHNEVMGSDHCPVSIELFSVDSENRLE